MLPYDRCASMMQLPLLIAVNTSVIDLLIAAAIVVSGVIASLVVRHVMRSAEQSVRLQSSMAILMSRFATTTIMLISLVYAFRQLGVQVGPLLGALGISGIVFAMSLQPVLGNLVGSALIHARKPIKRGDQLQTNGLSGTVIDINGRAVVMMTFDGERVHIPNLAVLDSPLINQTAQDYRRTLIPFQVDYDTDLRRTQRVVQAALAELDILSDSPMNDVLVTSFDESGISLVARVWHPCEELLARFAISESAITIHETLRREGISIPFPQRVVHFAERRVDDADEQRRALGHQE